jgi:tetratricopeptide (TPR) repeat protein
MAKRRIVAKNQDDTLLDLEEVTGKAKSFWDQYQTILLAVVAGIAIIAGGSWAYINLYKLPKEKEAADQMFQAELQFQKDSFQLALENPGGGFEGFLGVMDKYSGTKAANLAKYYAGISYLNLGNADDAIKYLTDYSPKTELMTIMTYGALGDAHGEKNDLDKSLTFYEKAVKAGDNDAVTPYYLKKMGLLHEKQGNVKAALEAYTKIKEKYPNSPDGQTIEKYIHRAEAGTM